MASNSFFSSAGRTSTKEQLRELVDQLTEVDAEIALDYLQSLIAEDDDDLTPAEAERIAESRAAFERGDYSDWADVKRELEL